MTGEMIDRVDVIKGPVSALYGDQNRAGSVAIATTALPSPNTQVRSKKWSGWRRFGCRNW